MNIKSYQTTFSLSLGILILALLALSSQGSYAQETDLNQTTFYVY